MWYYNWTISVPTLAQRLASILVEVRTDILNVYCKPRNIN